MLDDEDILLGTDKESLVPMDLDPEPEGYAETEEAGGDPVDYEDADLGGDLLPPDGPGLLDAPEVVN